jgi:hypothetical protein
MAAAAPRRVSSRGCGATPVSYANNNTNWRCPATILPAAQDWPQRRASDGARMVWHRKLWGANARNLDTVQCSPIAEELGVRGAYSQRAVVVWICVVVCWDVFSGRGGSRAVCSSCLQHQNRRQASAAAGCAKKTSAKCCELGRRDPRAGAWSAGRPPGHFGAAALMALPCHLRGRKTRLCRAASRAQQPAPEQAEESDARRGRRSGRRRRRRRGRLNRRVGQGRGWRCDRCCGSGGSRCGGGVALCVENGLAAADYRREEAGRVDLPHEGQPLVLPAVPAWAGEKGGPGAVQLP